MTCISLELKNTVHRKGKQEWGAGLATDAGAFVYNPTF